MTTAHYALVFVRPPRERLSAAARLVAELPLFLGGADGELDLHHCVATAYTAAVVRAPREAFTPDVLARLAFWIARAGAQPILLEALPEEKRARLAADIGRCERALTAARLAQAPEAAGRFFRALGVSSPPPAGARPVLAVDLDGPGAEGIAYRPEARALFIAGVLAPPRADQLALSVRHDGAPAPVEGWATVAEVRARRDAGPGRPAGFTLRVEGPPALHEVLAQHARGSSGRDVRAAPRYPVKAPVRVTPAAAASAAASPSPAPTPAPRARVEYATDQELAADWIENLSHGGAFVRTASPHPV
ncbi:MAG TPA: hypothetical protein VFK90_06145, partial [Anaeromyxobacter sp.]|nr:hypothetical protein [Anaeromyxobacter sp.]